MLLYDGSARDPIVLGVFHLRPIVDVDGAGVGREWRYQTDVLQLASAGEFGHSLGCPLVPLDVE